MDIKRQWEYYMYPWPQYIRIMASVFVLIGILLMLFGCCNALVLPGDSNSDTWGLVLISIFGILWTYASFSWANAFPNIRVTQNGLAIHFLLDWRFIPWGDILEIESEPRNIKGIPGNRMATIRVRKLTLFHRSLSFVVGRQVGASVFCIGSNIPRYHELLRIIRENMREFDGNLGRLS
jgi:hypothetical protein